MEEIRLIFNSGVQVFDMRLIDERGLHQVIGHILDDLQKKGAYLHVSFDIDYLDPTLTPGTGTIIPGGLNYRETLLCVEMIHASGFQITRQKLLFVMITSTAVHSAVNHWHLR